MKNKLHVLASFFILSSCSTLTPTNNLNSEQKNFKVKSSTQETMINTTLTSNAKPSIAMNRSTGDFVIVWQHNNGTDNDIYAQRFDSTGTAVGSEFLVNTTTTDNQTNPRVSMDNTGRFVVVWESQNQDGSGIGIYAQRFDSSGLQSGLEFLVNSSITNLDQINPAIDINVTNGDFIIAYENIGASPNSAIQVKKYNSSGSALTSFAISTTSSGINYRQPSVGMASNGKFAISWQENFNNVNVMAYNSSGSSFWASPKRVNTGNTTYLTSIASEVKMEGTTSLLSYPYSQNYPIVSWLSIYGTETLRGRKVTDASSSTIPPDPSFTPYLMSSTINTTPKVAATTSRFILTWVYNNNVYYKRLTEKGTTSFNFTYDVDSSPVLDNTLTTANNSDVAMSNTFTFVTTWEGTDGNIYIQMHDSSGNKV